MSVDPDRLAKVAVSTSAGLNLASGYLVTHNLLLTAAHAVQGAEAAIKVRFSGTNDEWEPAQIVWRSAEADDAVLLKLNSPRELGTRVQLGRCERLRAQWIGGGFPSAGARDEVRESVGVGGFVEPLGGAVSGLYDLTVEGSAPKAELWRGLSGGPVFVQDFLVGVLRSVPRAFAGQRLCATPIARLFEDASFRELLGKPSLVMLEAAAAQRGAILTDGYSVDFDAGNPTLRRRAGNEQARVEKRWPVEHRPRPVSSLLDRRETLARFSSIPGSSSLALDGPSGVGKTAILRELGQRELTPGSGGLVYVNAEDMTLLDLMQDLHDRFYVSVPRVKVTSALFQERFRQLSACVLLDDFGLARPGLEQLLNMAPKLIFAIASEQPCGFSSDWVSDSIRGLPKPEALLLLQQTLGRSLSIDEQSAAKQLFELAQGHPQTLLNHAALARRQNVHLAEVLRELTAVNQREGARKLLGWLGKRELKVLAALSAFGGILLRASDVFALTGDVLAEPDLERLVADGLLKTDGEVYALAPDAPRLASDIGMESRLLEQQTAWAERAQGDLPELVRGALRLRRLLHVALESQHTPAAMRLARAIEPGFSQSGLWDCWRQLLEAVSSAALRIADPAISTWATTRLELLDQCWPKALPFTTGTLGTTPPPAWPGLSLSAKVGLGVAAVAALVLGVNTLLPPSPAPLGTTIDSTYPEPVLPSASAALPVASLPDAGPPTEVDAGDASAPVSPSQPAPSDPPPKPPPPRKLPKPVFVPSTLDFGTVVLNKQEVASAVVLRNAGDASLTIRNIAVSPPRNFLANSERCPGALAPKASCVLSVLFTPNAPGDFKNAKLVLQGSADASLPLLAKAVMSYSVSPSQLTFPTSKPTASVVLRNLSVIPLRVTQAFTTNTVNPADRSTFRVDPRQCATLPPNGRCLMLLTANPGKPENSVQRGGLAMYSGTLTIRVSGGPDKVVRLSFNNASIE